MILLLTIRTDIGISIDLKVIMKLSHILLVQKQTKIEQYYGTLCKYCIINFVCDLYFT